MLGLNWNVTVEFMVGSILMVQSLVVVLTAILMLHKSLHPTVNMVLSVVVSLELVKTIYWLVVMLMVWSSGV